MVYKEKNRGFQVGKIYAVRNEQTIYHNDGTKTIIGEETPVRVTKIENTCSDKSATVEIEKNTA